MYISELTLNNFRNYEMLHQQFENKMYVIVGKNAQGKTNLLEAIYLTCIGKSPRTVKEREMINYNTDSAKIEIICKQNFGDNKVQFYIRRSGRKCVYINGMPLSKMGQLMGSVNAVYFSPDELKLIKECPEDRRRFMDISLCQMSRTYFYKITKANKILEQRNKLLKEKNLTYIKKTLPIWDSELSKISAEIAKERYNLIQTLMPLVKIVHSNLTDGSEEIQLSYQGFTQNIDQPQEQLAAQLLTLLEQNFEKDFKLGYTTAGVQRDDIKILINGRDVKIYGSQGQHRTVALSLKLAEVQAFYLKNKEYPVLLLDDVLSELDEARQLKLMQYASSVQTFLTCTHIDEKLINSVNANIIKVSEGKII